MKLRIFAALCGLLFFHPSRAAAVDPGQCWPQWRGPLGTGVAPLADPPLTWSETNHVKWKTPIPGEGDSTPIVWGDRVFLLTAIPTGKKIETKPAVAGPSKPKVPDEVLQFAVVCCDRAGGGIRWQKVAREEAPHEGHHPDHGFASSSPATDGQVLLANFGSRGLYCFDLDGNLKWSKDFGKLRIRSAFGEASSPALYKDTVVVCRDDESDNCFIVALDKRTGAELWRTPRKEGSGWATPLIVEAGGRTQAIVNASNVVRSYDLSTGKEIWTCAGQTANAIPTPVASDDTVYVTSGFRGSALYAIALGRQGDLTGTDAVRWTYKKNTPYVPSPLLAGGYIYVVAVNNAVLSCVEAKTGAPQFEAERLADLSAGIYASPVAAKDRIYVLGRDGACLVLRTGPKIEILASNKLGDKGAASLALAGNDLFMRGRKFLYRISEK